MSFRENRTYDKEFKLEAIRLVTEEGRNASEVERNLVMGKEK
jgi:transposase-like protein